MLEGDTYGRLSRIVYVLINEAMPEYLQVGKTGSIERRLQDRPYPERSHRPRS